MYLVVIAWIYVVLMMSVAEATNTTGTVLGAVVTFTLYGLLPVVLIVYLMRTPARKKALKKRRDDELAAYQAQSGTAPSELPSHAPNDSSHAASGSQAVTGSTSVAAMREKP